MVCRDLLCREFALRRIVAMATAVLVAVGSIGIAPVGATETPPPKSHTRVAQDVGSASVDSAEFFAGRRKVREQAGVALGHLLEPAVQIVRGQSKDAAGVQSTDEPLDVIVAFEPGAEDKVLEFTRGQGGTLARRSKTTDFMVVTPPRSMTASKFAASAAEVDGVRYAEPDAAMHAFLVPNDPRYSSQWGMARIGGPSAWDVSMGSASTKIAIVDTGVDLDHSDLVGHIDTANDWDFINNDSSAQDDQGHGTHCAGIAAASTNNGILVSGVAGACTILPVKVLGSDGSGSSSGVADGIRWAADHGADVISLSLGSNSYTSVIDEAVQYSAGLGCVIVAASGNDSAYGISYPARLANVMAVGSTTESDSRSYFSNYGPDLDICAPGSDILSTTYDGGVGYKSGTSMATPYVAGVAGLVRSVHPTWTRQEVEAQLESTAYDLGSSGQDIYFGHGLVQADAAIGSSSPPPVPTGDNDIPGVAIPASPVADSVDSTSDRWDVYQLPLVAGQTVSLSLSSPSAADIDLFLFSPGASSVYSSTPLDSSQGVTYPETVEYEAATSGTHYVAVKAFSGSGTYSLTYSTSGGGSSDDDIPGVAIPASPIAGTLTAYSDVDDVFSVSLTEGQTFEASISGASGTDFDLYFYPPGSTSVWTDSAVAGAVGVTYPDEFTYTAPATGTYYLDLYAYSGSGSYSVTYSISSSTPTQPDDDIPGTPIGSSPQGGTLDDSTDWLDVYSCALSAGDHITVGATGPSGTDFDLYLFGPDASSVFTAEPVAYGISSSYPESVEYTIPSGAGGTYYLAIAAFSGSGSYSITYSVGLATNDDNIPGVPIPASPVSGSVAEVSDYDDVYSISLDAGETLEFALSGPVTADFDLFLYAPGSADVWNDTPVDGSTMVGYPEEVSYTVPSGQGGTYYVDVFAFSGSGSYTLTWQVTGTGGGDDENIPGVPIPASPVMGTVSDSSDVDDVFSIVLNEGDTFVVELTGSAGTDFDALLFPPGSTDTWSDDFVEGALTASYPDRFVYTVPSGRGGTYYLDVWAYDGSGAYTLTYRHLESVAGTTRYTTAVEASQEAFDSADTVVIATGENWPDALGGAALAGVVDGPLLLTKPGYLSTAVKNEISRLNAQNVYILGGLGAVSAEVAAELDARVSGTVLRLAGSNRYTTARIVADEVIRLQGAGYSGDAFVVTGSNFPDALGASPLSAAWGDPILLTKADAMPSLPSAVDSVVILGGTAVVTETTEDLLNSALDSNVLRIGGSNRYETAAFVAEWGVAGGMQWDGVGIATGSAFPDALSGGAMLGSMNSVMLLTKPTLLSSQAENRLEWYNDVIDHVHFVGGLGALSEGVRDQVGRALQQE